MKKLFIYFIETCLDLLSVLIFRIAGRENVLFFLPEVSEVSETEDDPYSFIQVSKLIARFR